MKRIKTIIKLSCYLISLMMLLFSCADGNQDTSTQKNDAKIPDAPANPIMLIANGNAKYTIVNGEIAWQRKDNP